MDFIMVLKILLGYFVSIGVGNLVTARCVRNLWLTVPTKKDQPSLRTSKIISFWLGTSERGLYTTTILLGRPEGIAVWLTFKAVMRWRVYDEDPRHIPGSSIYQIGTIISLLFGIAGGLIATWKFKL